MKKIYIGIDPGYSGGVSGISDNGEVLFCLPFSKETYTTVLISKINEYKSENVTVCLERVHAMPGQGVTSMFNFGKNFGFIEGVLSALNISYQTVPPQTWKKEFSLSASKELSSDVCKKLFKDVNLLASARCRKPHDGMSESLLMAEYARRKF